MLEKYLHENKKTCSDVVDLIKKQNKKVLVYINMMYYHLNSNIFKYGFARLDRK